MPQPKKAARFGGSPAHHNQMMANLATELIRHGRIRTTHAKAKTVQPLAERMITFAKRGDLHSRRQVLKVIRDRDVVHKLFDSVGPTFAERDGGYTRVLKLGPRKGDAAMMALLSLVEGVESDGVGQLEEAPRRRWSLRRTRGSQSTGARERSEERMALVDRGEEPEAAYEGEFEEDFEEDFDEELDELEDEELDELDDEEATDSDLDQVQADPGEVEARLAAEDAAAEAEQAEQAERAKEAEATEEVEITETETSSDEERG